MTSFERALAGAAAILTGAVALLAAAGLALYMVTPAQADADPSPMRQAELTHLLIQDCGSCHGLTLAGGLGPALTPAALDGKPAEYLALVILHGRPGTAMPPWRPFLTETEAGWLAARLKEPRP